MIDQYIGREIVSPADRVPPDGSGTGLPNGTDQSAVLRSVASDGSANSGETSNDPLAAYRNAFKQGVLITVSDVYQMCGAAVPHDGNLTGGDISRPVSRAKRIRSRFRSRSQSR